MAEIPQTASSHYQTCRTLFTKLRQLIEVDAPRSLSAPRKNDLYTIDANLQAWFEDVSSIRPGEALDVILSRSILVVNKLLPFLEGMRDDLTQSKSCYPLTCLAPIINVFDSLSTTFFPTSPY